MTRVSAPRRIELLHWNDVHGRYDGLARLAQRARTIREQADHPVLVLDGGDVEETGVRLSALTFGVAGWRMLGAAGVDAAVAGNGGLLRYGPDLLPRYAAAVGFPPVVCDLERDGATPEGAAASRLLTAGDLSVGVVGVTDYYAAYDDFGLRERGRTTAAVREARSLRRQGADVVVVLSHAGLAHDQGLSWHLRGLVDVVVGGHSHHLLTEGDRSHGIPIAQAGCYAEHLGRVLLEVDDTGTRVVDMTVERVPDDTPQDPAVVAERDACERDLAAWLDEPVGELPVPVPLAGEADDSPAARLLLEALLARRPADLGVLMPMHLTRGLPQGRVTRGDVWEATSSPGNLTTATLSGAVVRRLLERGAGDDFAEQRSRSGRGPRFGRLQTLGVERRDGVLWVAGAPLADDRDYRVTASDIELSSYGTLVEAEPADLHVEVPRILPELLEEHLREAYPAG